MRKKMADGGMDDDDLFNLEETGGQKSDEKIIRKVIENENKTGGGGGEVIIKYAVIEDGDDSTIITEDGGIATVYNNGEYIIAELYQDKPEKFDFSEESTMFDELAEGKKYLEDYEDKQEIDDEVIQDCLNWLVFSPDYDEFTFKKVPFHILVKEYNERDMMARGGGIGLDKEEIESAAYDYNKLSKKGFSSSDIKKHFERYGGLYSEMTNSDWRKIKELAHNEMADGGMMAIGGMSPQKKAANHGRAWTLDHYQFNKKENYEIPIKRRRL
jgi:hypothetical protein